MSAATAGEAAAGTVASRRTRRYREAERALWKHYGLEPNERFIELERQALRLRVLEVGSGAPVLFVPGTAGTGPSWGALVRALSGFRCLLLDPPNSGLSSRLDYAGRQYGVVIADVLGGVLDALGLDHTHAVGSSIGNVSALRLAASRPARVDRVVLLGAGPLLPESRVPGILRVIASPLGGFMNRVPPSRRGTRAVLRQIGHGPSLASGRIPGELIDWRVAFDRDTDTLRDERDAVRALVRWRTGRLRPGVTFEPGELAAVAQPTLLVHGTADPTGTIDACRRAAGLLPRSEVKLVEGAGHLPWLDDPVAVAGHIGRFLARS